MRLLARREYSRAELHARLLPHIQPEDDLDALLDQFESRNWLSDARAAEQLIGSRRSRFGTQRIAHELRQKGIAESLIEQALPQLRESELEAAREVWQRKFGELPQDQKEKARQVRFLQSRGFSLDVVLRILRTSETY